MSDSRELATIGQQTLDDQLFSRFVNLKVAVGLSGSQQFPAEELLELAGEGRLEKGREVTVTARFFVADSGLSVTRTAEYGGGDRYGFGGGKVGLKLVAIESLQVGEQKLTGAVAKLCECVVRRDGDERPDGYRVSKANGWWSRTGCELCDGLGLLHPTEYDAPYANKHFGSYNETLILVDTLPAPKPVPQGCCPQCAMQPPRHSYACPEREYIKQKREDEVKDAGPVRANGPDCFGDYDAENVPECTEECCMHVPECIEATQEIVGEPAE